VPELAGWHRRFILRSILSAFGGDVVGVHGIQRLAGDRDPFLVAVNHSTRLEALVLPILFAYFRQGRLISFVADWNFALMPGIATILRCGETILVVRKPARPAVLNCFKPYFERKGSAFDQAAAALRRGRSVGMFPEGTTNRHPTRLLRGFDGVARLSLTTGRPVIPVGVRFPGQPAGEPVRDRARMEIFVGEPLDPPQAGAEPSREGSREWHAVIMRAIARLSGKTWDPDSTRRKHDGFE
jgi:1-acyl-sn-glycerol-3-phosphate acyltransferase